MILIKNAIVYKSGDDGGIIWDGAIVIEGDRIVEVCETHRLDPSYRRSADIVIDGKWKIAFPGLIDAHIHLDASYLRGLIKPTWMGWLRTYFGWYFNLLDGEGFYYSALFSIARRLLTGTTAIIDAGPLPGYEEEAVKAVSESGIRANLNRITMDTYDEPLGVGVFAEKHRETTEQALRRGRDFVKRYDGHLGRVRAGLCLMQVPTTSPELGRGARQIVEELGGTLHTHAGVHGELLQATIRMYGKRDIEYLDDIGVLCDRLTAAHMGWLSEREIELVVSRNVNVAHCPTSTTINGKGILRRGDIVRLWRRGVNVALGTDELDITDMVRVMFATLVHRDIWMDPSLFTLEDVVKMATINGAKAMGVKNLGRLEKGYLADVVLFDLRDFEMVPSYGYSLLANLITSASGRVADTVIVGGRIIVRGRRLTTIDVTKLSREIQRRAERFAEEAVEEGIQGLGADARPAGVLEVDL